MAKAMLDGNKAPILLLDEPTSHLDADSQRKVLANLFQNVEQNKQTVLMVAHRLETAVEYCDLVLVLDDGKLVDFAPPEKLLFESDQDAEVTKKDSLFAEMVLALSKDQQQKIVSLIRS